MGKPLHVEIDDGKLVIYRNVDKLLQSYAMIFLDTKIIKCSLITGSQRWISCITLNRKEYMLLVQFNWTVWGYPLDASKDLMKNGRGAIDYRYDSSSGIMAAKSWSIIAWLISHQTLLELSHLGSLKDGPERGWEKQSMSSKCSRIQLWHLIDMAETNAWILYRRHFRQHWKTHKGY